MGTGVGLPRNVQGIGGVATFTGPDQGKDRVDFKGRSMFVYRERMSGALRIAIDLDGAGTGCKASAINGRQGGKNIVQHILGDAQVEVSSVQVQSVNCSIKEGNVFGQWADAPNAALRDAAESRCWLAQELDLCRNRECDMCHLELAFRCRRNKHRDSAEVLESGELLLSALRRSTAPDWADDNTHGTHTNFSQLHGTQTSRLFLAENLLGLPEPNQREQLLLKAGAFSSPLLKKIKSAIRLPRS
jgi:hypothetical protein